MAVEIEAGHVASRHAVNDSIWIDHGNDDELELGKQVLLCFCRRGKELLDEVFSDE